MNNENILKCRVCESNDLCIVRQSNIKKAISSRDFAITDYNYGITSTIYKCKKCGFLQCLEVNNILSYYEELVDVKYEQSRRERSIQMKMLLEKIKKKIENFRSEMRLLDIGAGSGILVEEALKMNFQAEGIEPSKWLCETAGKYHLPVYNITIQNQAIKRNHYDIITMIDVIEHVAEPYHLLVNAKNCMKKDGLLVIVTPNVKSLVAMLLGWKWWHFRIAHVGYYSFNTIKLLLKRAGFEILSVHRPGWYFKISYLTERINSYLPNFLHLPNFTWMQKNYIPLNLLDSMMVIAKIKKTT